MDPSAIVTLGLIPVKRPQGVSTFSEIREFLLCMVSTRGILYVFRFAIGQIVKAID
jgi:hypothetical protein